MEQALMLGLTVATGSALAVLGVLMVLSGLARRKSPPLFVQDMADQATAFIFRDEALVDCTDAGAALLASLRKRRAGDMPQDSDSAAPPDQPLHLLLDYLAPHFPNLRAELASLAQHGQLQLDASDGSGLRLDAQFSRGLAQLRLVDLRDEGALVAIDRLSLDALHEELQCLRDVTRAAPVLIWQTDACGQVSWANSGYLRALQQYGHNSADLGWPLPALFDAPAQGGRVSCMMGEQKKWFAYSSGQSGAQKLHFATPIDATIQSEFARREMMQMLTRIFATLPIGLALFDAERRLQVFNPALVDLTGLDPYFLTARPDFGQFLHALREQRMLPEPKDFASWRDALLRMEQAAVSGTYCEEWHLDTGRVYHVTTSPQPDGAHALFMRDITSDATLLRGYRAEIDSAQAVLDAMPDAVLAFDRAGQAVMTNAAYVELWGDDPCADLAHRGLAQSLADWVQRCPAGGFWSALERYAKEGADAPALTGSGTLPQGVPVALRAQGVAGGGLVVSFRALLRAIPQAPRHDPMVADRLMRPDKAGPDPVAPSVLTGLLADGPGNPSLSGAAVAPPSAMSGQQAKPRKTRSVRHKGNRLRV
ncbi:MAG: PAS-domain containing protein [Rhodobacteraceae bacterium]|nr:PAS-domain containing protein [Paracoccaceae bacterium]